MSLRDCFDRLAAGGITSDKGTAHDYLGFYEDLLAPRRDLPLTLLEIGILEGASLALWRAYFTAATVIGVDRVPNPRPAPYTVSVISDATDPFTYADIGPFDIVIDDGSHLDDDIAAVFTILRDRLNDGAVYVIEDIQNDVIVERMQALAPFREVDLRGPGHRYDDRLLVLP